ncbi:MAG: type II toxin-antitoxin system RelE/ParE family toxin [Dehalococcoidales bacterium]|nr:type II toxin-antitoxin system RelE/ParE family toxin [Dehalococcoidales bacterium]
MIKDRKILYYTSSDGEQVVKNEIGKLEKRDISKVLKLISHLEMYGEYLRGDDARHIKGKIWELRPDRIRCLYFTYVKNTFVLLRVFMKKTQKTPENEIKIAERRMKDYLNRFPKESG